MIASHCESLAKKCRFMCMQPCHTNTARKCLIVEAFALLKYAFIDYKIILKMNFNSVLYQANALPIGIEIFGINLNQPISDIVKKKIIKDVTKHRIMVFRNQVSNFLSLL